MLFISLRAPNPLSYGAVLRLGFASSESHEGERSLFVTNGHPLAAGAVDSGGVAARQLLGMKVALAVWGGSETGARGWSTRTAHDANDT